jgi:hypothetical protein
MQIAMRLGALFLCLVACSTARGKNGKDSEPCSVIKVTGGALITCPDGSSAFVANGEPGPAGMPGESGQNGGSCHVVQTADDVTIACDDGSSATLKTKPTCQE